MSSAAGVDFEESEEGLAEDVAWNPQSDAKPHEIEIAGNDALWMVADPSGSMIHRLVTHVDDVLLRVSSVRLRDTGDDSTVGRVLMAVAEEAVSAGLVAK